MNPMPDAFLLLRRVHLFKGLSDDELREVAEKFHYEEHEPNVAIFHQGDPSEAFYMIEHGTVAVVRQKGTQDQTVSRLTDGDYFGELGLLHRRRRAASVQTETKVGLWRLEAEDFYALLEKYPQIRDNLDVVVETRQSRQRRQFPWLEPEEIVYLISGKHLVLLWVVQIPGILTVILALAAAIGGYYYFRTAMAFYLFIPVALLAVGWLIWNYVDWDNDLYIVTSKRVVDFEKIVLIYDSREEAPIATCRNVNVVTSQFGRILGYGDVVINTFSGDIVFRRVPNPRAIADIVQEQLNRQRTRTARSDRHALKRSLRLSMGLDRPPEEGRTTPVAPVKREREPLHIPNPLTQALGHFTFKVRTETGGTVTYHKHPLVLVQRLALPTLLLLGLLVVLGMRIFGAITILDGLTFFVAWLVPLLAVSLWWLYIYEDWRNDIYQVTPDQILDISRKPLGQEIRKTAPLNNILSIKTDRPTLLALVFNYGTVLIQTGPGGEMRFEGVFAPLQVQQDIFRQMEVRQQRAAAAEVAAERDRIAKVLGAFYEVTLDEQRARLSQRQRALREEIALVAQEMNDLVGQVDLIDEAIRQAPYERLDQAAVARLQESQARAGQDYAVAEVRRRALETDLENVEREIRQMEEAAQAVQ
jgi:hypothetical protein